MTQQHTPRTPVPSRLEKVAELYRQYSPAIFTYLSQRAPGIEDAEDILVEVFLAALENAQFSTLPEKAQLAWLWRVARNKIVDAYRRSQRHESQSVLPDTLEESISDPEDPEHLTLQQEEYEILQGHLKSLSEQQQKVLLLRFGQDMRCAEIAAQMGKSEGAIKVMLSRTLNLLKNIYKGRREE